MLIPPVCMPGLVAHQIGVLDILTVLATYLLESTYKIIQVGTKARHQVN